MLRIEHYFGFDIAILAFRMLSPLISAVGDVGRPGENRFEATKITVAAAEQAPCS
jgi:hypothetical protein